MSKKRPSTNTWNSALSKTGSIIGITVTILGLLYYAIFIWANFQMNPQIVLRLPGQHQSSELILPDTVSFYLFALATNNSKEIILQSIEPYYNLEESIHIEPIDSADVFHQDLSDHKDFAFKLSYSCNLKISQGHVQAFAFAYSLHDTSKVVNLLFRTRGQVAQWDWGFPLNLFSSFTKQQDFPVQVKFCDLSRLPNEERFDKTSIPILPHEAMNFNGSSLRCRDLMARTLEGEGTLKTRTLHK